MKLAVAFAAVAFWIASFVVSAVCTAACAALSATDFTATFAAKLFLYTSFATAPITAETDAEVIFTSDVTPSKVFFAITEKTFPITCAILLVVFPSDPAPAIAVDAAWTIVCNCACAARTFFTFAFSLADEFVSAITSSGFNSVSFTL